jgi:hypothetical protein
LWSSYQSLIKPFQAKQAWVAAIIGLTKSAQEIVDDLSDDEFLEEARRADGTREGYIRLGQWIDIAGQWVTEQAIRSTCSYASATRRLNSSHLNRSIMSGGSAASRGPTQKVAAHQPNAATAARCGCLREADDPLIHAARPCDVKFMIGQHSRPACISWPVAAFDRVALEPLRWRVVVLNEPRLAVGLERDRHFEGPAVALSKQLDCN